MVKFLPLGGAGEIGANCYYLNIAGTGIILDCGMNPQKIDFKPTKNIFEIEGYQHKSSEPIKISFHDAGHILGSVGILIEHDEKKIFYTGDINLTDQTLLRGCELPKEKVDTLIFECTYGATDSHEIL